MTNSMRGDVAFEAGGKSYVIRLTTNAMVEYQDLTGETFLVGCTAIERDPTDIKRLRALIWAGLSHHQSGISQDEVGDLIDDVGLLAMAAKLSDAIEKAFPDVGEKSGNAVKPAVKKKRTGA